MTRALGPHKEADLVVVTMTSAVIMGALGTSAAKSDPIRQPHRGRPKHRPQEMLDLDEDQRRAVASLHRSTDKKITVHQAQIRVARIDLEALTTAAIPTREEMHTQIRSIAALEAEMRIIKLDHHLAIHELLTPQQRQHLKHWHHGLNRPRDPRHPTTPPKRRTVQTPQSRTRLMGHAKQLPATLFHGSFLTLQPSGYNRVGSVDNGTGRSSDWLREIPHEQEE